MFTQACPRHINRHREEGREGEGSNRRKRAEEEEKVHIYVNIYIQFTVYIFYQMNASLRFFCVFRLYMTKKQRTNPNDAKAKVNNLEVTWVECRSLLLKSQATDCMLYAATPLERDV